MNTISTTFASLDEATMTGGVPCGHITEVMGGSATCKSSLVLRILAEAQRQGHVGLLIDGEHSYSASWAEQLGVDTTTLMVVQPKDLTMMEQIVTQVLIQQLCDLIVIDSIDAYVPTGNDGTAYWALSHFLKKLAIQIEDTGLTALIVSQYRETAEGFRSTCNETMRQVADLRILLSQVSTSEHHTEVEAAIKRNNLAPECKTTRFRLEF